MFFYFIHHTCIFCVCVCVVDVYVVKQPFLTDNYIFYHILAFKGTIQSEETTVNVKIE